MDEFDLLFNFIWIVFILIFFVIDRLRSYAVRHGYFLAGHRWARKIACRAQELISPYCTFYDSDMEFFISQYLESRIYNKRGYYRKNELVKFYQDDSRILLMLLSISYQTMLLAEFRGTECAVARTYPYQEIFDAAVRKLEGMGYDCSGEIDRCKALVPEAHEFCNHRNFDLFK